jgi:four helix bundle protein
MQESPLFSKTYDFLLWIIPQVQKYPRQHRFGLAERIQRLALDFQDTIIAAGKSKREERKLWLLKADIQLEQLRNWLRLSRDLQLLSIPQYEHAARMIVEVGRLLGAWIKQA